MTYPEIKSVIVDDLLRNDPIHKYTEPGKNFVVVPNHAYPYQLAADVPPHCGRSTLRPSGLFEFLSPVSRFSWPAVDYAFSMRMAS